ncbi:unnamed protein product [Eruca vesicaria subsp. sativa]|uniref:RWP-RK domain-containing protein n=1 Tax=Eruca vesicaria subsp. sativa TaxID=29727 RepID=A0ABC8KJZ3_ERUVS|nr:unnamed protein product [Eruca vesicaria subsp. sativa]
MEFDKVSGEEDKLVDLEYFSFQSEFTNSFFQFEDKILSSGKYDSHLTCAASFLAFPDLEPISINSPEDPLEEYGSVSWSAKESMSNEDNREDCLVKETETQTTEKIRDREDFASDCSVSKPLSKETISLYYHMSITQAAKELNIGVTLLKKKCRDLGIHRWPYHKWMSLQNVINNVEEKLEKGEGNADELRNDLEKPKKEQKIIVEFPDLENIKE